jgi:hypothetical protein
MGRIEKRHFSESIARPAEVKTSMTLVTRLRDYFDGRQDADFLKPNSSILRVSSL